jgi:hypothetical protein
LLFVLGVLKEEDVLELGLYLASPEKYKDALKQAKHQTVAPIIIADSTGTYFEISVYCTSMLPVKLSTCFEISVYCTSMLPVRLKQAY